mmetsp:Transcript_8671/g.28428  ORF Transcript_8671/g.28428 Transcript_8671/m.28428 type:complete len:272 (-) Transcript_8671:553-1368(-)
MVGAEMLRGEISEIRHHGHSHGRASDYNICDFLKTRERRFQRKLLLYSFFALSFALLPLLFLVIDSTEELIDRFREHLHVQNANHASARKRFRLFDVAFCKLKSKTRGDDTRGETKQTHFIRVVIMHGNFSFHLNLFWRLFLYFPRTKFQGARFHHVALVILGWKINCVFLRTLIESIHDGNAIQRPRFHVFSFNAHPQRGWFSYLSRSERHNVRFTGHVEPSFAPVGGERIDAFHQRSPIRADNAHIQRGRLFPVKTAFFLLVRESRANV